MGRCHSCKIVVAPLTQASKKPSHTAMSSVSRSSSSWLRGFRFDLSLDGAETSSACTRAQKYLSVHCSRSAGRTSTPGFLPRIRSWHRLTSLLLFNLCGNDAVARHVDSHAAASTASSSRSMKTLSHSPVVPRELREAYFFRFLLEGLSRELFLLVALPQS